MTVKELADKLDALVPILGRPHDSLEAAALRLAEAHDLEQEAEGAYHGYEGYSDSEDGARLRTAFLAERKALMVAADAYESARAAWLAQQKEDDA